MSVRRTLDKLAAVLRRDLLTAARYRTGFAITAAGALVQLAAFYFLARAIGPGFHPQGVDYFPFVLVGTGLYTFLLMGINSFLNVVQDAQRSGTLEVLMTTSTSGPLLIFLSAVSAFAGNTVQLVFYFGVGLAVFGAPLHANLAGCLAVFVLAMLIAVAVGMFAAALQLAIRKGSAVVWLLGSGAWFMTGALFPVGALPKPLRLTAEFIPLTHVLDGMRMALLQGARFRELAPQLGVLALFCAVLLPASVVLFSYCLRRARLDGTLSFY